MNWVLVEAGYPKVFIPIEFRAKYYQALDFHNEKKVKEYCNLMFDVLVEQLSTKKKSYK